MAQEFRGSGISLEAMGKLEDEAVVVLIVKAAQGPSQICGRKNDQLGLWSDHHFLSYCSVLLSWHSYKQGRVNTETPQWWFHEMYPMNPSFIFSNLK